MNIEEARSKLISFIDFYNKKPKEENRKFKMLQVDNIDIKAIETLLTAYEKEKEKNKEYENMIINHKKQLKQSGIYGYDYDLKILKEE